MFYGILVDLWRYGRDVSPRGLPCREVTDYQYTLPPRVRFMCFDHRKLKLDYIKQEFVWYLRARRDDVSIKHVAKMWDGLINVDGTINSNYGYYVFNKEAGDGKRSNFSRVLAELLTDPDSRRASICILDNDHLNSETRDYPCTSYLNFHIRDNKLHMYVRMRSQDAVFGMGNDAPCFSFIHEMLWAALRSCMDKPGQKRLELGDYHHTADSFHVYERHYEMVEKILEDPVVTVDHHVGCPMIDPDRLLLIKLGQAARDAGLDGRTWASTYFSRWLLERDDPTTLVQMEVP